MRWQGGKLKMLVAGRNLTQAAFSERVGVTRQAFSAWVRGQVPKGIHLLKICRELGVPAEAFFEDAQPSPLLAREPSAVYVTARERAAPVSARRMRHGTNAIEKRDPFLSLLELADGEAPSLTNSQIEELLHAN